MTASSAHRNHHSQVGLSQHMQSPQWGKICSKWPLSLYHAAVLGPREAKGRSLTACPKSVASSCGVGCSCGRQHFSRSGWTGIWAVWCSGRCPCLWHGVLNYMIFRFPSNPNHSMILWFRFWLKCVLDCHSHQSQSKDIIRYHLCCLSCDTWNHFRLA